ncbi:MAG: PAS domain-containing sensor histidine kinase [Spirulina sp. DLM2.Bin59]|nr:MAG: PAS domain-containing sensor histidine kinase [Spirulina sp. DLM2.Bin59]
MSHPLKPSIPHHLEYIITDPEFLIQEFSLGIGAILQESLMVGADIRRFLPELVGSEAIAHQVFQGQLPYFTIKEVAHYGHNNPNHPVYIDLNLERLNPQSLILFINDVTETAILRQSLVQRVNETELLLNALRRSEDYNRRIITSMGDALLTTNLSGNIKTVNPATLALFGYHEAELKNQPLALLFPDGLPTSLEPQSLQATTIHEDIEVNCQTKSGKILTIAFSCGIIHAQGDNLPVVIYIGRNITARKRVEQEINAALAKEKELNDLKSRFIAMTSHEFKNPLSSILMSVELLEEFALTWHPDKRLRHLQRIRQSTTQMNNLLEDILVIGKADTGKLEFHPQPLNLRQFCQDLVEELQFLAGESHEIILHLHGALAPQYDLDDKLLRHTFMNLLSNAVKYSPDCPRVDFRVGEVEGALIFEVEDHGIGVPEEDQPRLFESFHRSRNVREIKGTGLGLSIVKRAVELQGGKITFRSQVNVGTTFTVCLPLEAGWSS